MSQLSEGLGDVMTVFWRALKKTVSAYVGTSVLKNADDSPMRLKEKKTLKTKGDTLHNSTSLPHTTRKDIDLFGTLREKHDELSKSPQSIPHIPKDQNHKKGIVSDNCSPTLSLLVANDYAMARDDTTSQNDDPISVRGMNGGDFVVCHRIITPKPFPKKPPIVRRLQLLGVLSLFTLTFLTHAWVLVEQHVVRRLLTPLGIAVTGFFLNANSIQAQDNTKKNDSNGDIKPPSNQKEEGDKKTEAEKNTSENPKKESRQEGTANDGKKNDSTPKKEQQPQNSSKDPAKDVPNDNQSKSDQKNNPELPAQAGKDNKDNKDNKESGSNKDSAPSSSKPSEENIKSSEKEKNTDKDPDKGVSSKKGGEKVDKKADTVAFDPLSLNSTQVKILLSLHDRDQDLKKLEESFREKEAAHTALNAAMDKQLKEKRTELLELKKTVEALAQTTNKDTMENVKKMVTIYESMKPEEAAKIFNELPHVVLVGLMKKMNPKKASAILARMDVNKTKAITNTFSLAPYIPSGKTAESGKKK